VRKTLAISAIAAALAVAAFLLLRPRPAPVPQALRLADGVEIFFLTGSKARPAAGYPHPREIAVDGDFLFRVPASATPLVIRSRLLMLTVTGDTALRITAYAKEAGEQTEVLHGNVKASKSYPSPYAEPDLLGAGEMTMINRDIDLMEKETTDLAALRAWSEALVASEAKARAGEAR
jgi:hypothetical protein